MATAVKGPCLLNSIFHFHYSKTIFDLSLIQPFMVFVMFLNIESFHSVSSNRKRMLKFDKQAFRKNIGKIIMKLRKMLIMKTITNIIFNALFFSIVSKNSKCCYNFINKLYYLASIDRCRSFHSPW